MYLKYQLPSEPNVYVDLLDDEDVSLMFDEVRISPPPQHPWLVACSSFSHIGLITRQNLS